jgi:YidC/Oxa1 family membrane protein insertase
MFGWNWLVNGVAGLLCTLSSIYGGNLGLAILTVSVMVRLALLPLTLRVARHAQAHQKLLTQLKSEIEGLKKKYKTDRQRLASETAKLYQDRGVKLLDKGNLAASALQFLVGGGLYSAIRRNICLGGRFLWIRNLSQPNALLVLLTAAMTWVASALGQHLPEQNRFMTTAIPTIMTVIVSVLLRAVLKTYRASRPPTQKYSPLDTGTVRYVQIPPIQGGAPDS